MTSIGLLGSIDAGKTATFQLFMDYVKKTGHKIIEGNPGGFLGAMDAKKTTTLTVDFIRFTWKGQLHTLYGTGGHKKQITEYYRKYVLTTAEQFLIIIDLGEPLKGQFDFIEELMPLSTPSVVVNFNKWDIPKAKENFSNYEPMVKEFLEQHSLRIQEQFLTVALRKKPYQVENENCIRSILRMCEPREEDPFKIWQL